MNIKIRGYTIKKDELLQIPKNFIPILYGHIEDGNGNTIYHNVEIVIDDDIIDSEQKADREVKKILCLLQKGPNNIEIIK